MLGAASDSSRPLYAVVMAGGRGERFWPRSRKKLPKQFLPLFGKRTMIQMTCDRLRGVVPPERILVVTGADLVDMARRQLPELPGENIIAEPVGRNTAPCIGLAAVLVEARDPEAVLAVLPADHRIADEKGFRSLLRRAADLAAVHDVPVTLGITPSYPETGFGYIQAGAALDPEDSQDPEGARWVERFVEKPTLAKAREYLAAGNFYWNSGMFIWRAATVRRLVVEFLPEIHRGLQRIAEALGTPAFQETLAAEFSGFPSVSVDYGILEKTDRILVIPANIGWDDVGHWTSVSRLSPHDRDGNVIEGNVIAIDTKDSLISGHDRLIATIGLENVVIVESEDAVLICAKDRVQEVRQVLARLRERG
ncbi:MAG: mannose-1-phosphate guanylyltransferase, partial [Bacteroidota bacterium]